GKEPSEISIVRELIQVQSGKMQEMEPGLGYIRLRQFQERTAKDLVAGIEKLEKTGRFAGLIVDLRNNPGGLLSSAVEVSEEFLGDGKLVVYTEGRVRNQNMRFVAHAKHPVTDVPLVVLVNQGSASGPGRSKDTGAAGSPGPRRSGRGSARRTPPWAGGRGRRRPPANSSPRRGGSTPGRGTTRDIVIALPKEDPPKPGTPPLSEAE